MNALPLTDPDAYDVRMARVNITIPTDLVSRAKAAGLNISALASAAVEAELERLDRRAGLEEYWAELEAEFGPTPPEEIARIDAWADRVFGPKRT
jgi:post-segregation antitoxin (ccd killing protein)